MPCTICVVDKCYNKGIHKFPTDRVRKYRWLNALNCRSNYLAKDAKICFKHFLDSDYNNKEEGSTDMLLRKRMLKRNAVPSVFPAGVVGTKKRVQINKNHKTYVKKIQHSLSASKGSKKTTHENVTCNNCKDEIKGYRYKCIQCPDYDLCSSCEIIKIHSEHVVIRLSKPLPYRLLQDVLTPLRDIFTVNQNDWETNENVEILADGDQHKRNPVTKQNREIQSDDYLIEFLEDSVDSSESKSTVSLEPAVPPVLRIKSMEIFKVGPGYTLSEEDKVNFNVGTAPLKMYSPKVKSQSTNESTSDGDHRDVQVLTNGVEESLHNDFLKVEVNDQDLEVLEEDYIEEDVKFCDFDSE